MYACESSERESTLPNLSLVMNGLPVAPRLAQRLLRDFAEIEAVRATVDLDLDEMDRFPCHRDAMDAHDSHSVPHGCSFADNIIHPVASVG